MYIIKDTTSGYYFHNKAKIILFEQPEEAQWFLQNFQQYAVTRYVQEQQSPFAIMKVQQIISNFAIVQKDFLETPECGVIMFKDLGI